MNKQGQILGLSILTFLGLLIVGFMFVNFILPEVTTFRTNMDCSNAAGISDGNKVLCLVGGLSVPIFIVAVLSIAIGVITRRFIFK